MCVSVKLHMCVFLPDPRRGKEYRSPPLSTAVVLQEVLLLLLLLKSPISAKRPDLCP